MTFTSLGQNAQLKQIINIFLPKNCKQKQLIQVKEKPDNQSLSLPRDFYFASIL